MEWLLILILNSTLSSRAGADIHTERLTTKEECEKVGETFKSISTQIYDNYEYRCVEVKKK